MEAVYLDLKKILNFILLCDIFMYGDCHEYKFDNITSKSRIRTNKRSSEWMIIGGRESNITEFPFMAQVVTAPRGILVRHSIHWSCGGSLVSRRHVLTAAHCIVGNPTPGIFGVYYDHFIRVGTGTWDEEGQISPVERVFVHPQFYIFYGVPVYDLAVFVSSDDLTLNPIARFVQLPPPGADLNGLQERMGKCTVVGWGTTENGTKSRKLKSSRLPLLPQAECFKMSSNLVKFAWNSEAVLCTDTLGKFSSCHGDSGGPLLCGSSLVIWGVVSYTVNECLEPPAYFARVDTSVKFIQDSISGIVSSHSTGNTFILFIVSLIAIIKFLS